MLARAGGAESAGEPLNPPSVDAGTDTGQPGGRARGPDRAEDPRAVLPDDPPLAPTPTRILRMRTLRSWSSA